ncbi:MAG: hypothetical protein D6785_06655, partial [Planctomycetota bacterium]
CNHLKGKKVQNHWKGEGEDPKEVRLLNPQEKFLWIGRYIQYQGNTKTLIGKGWKSRPCLVHWQTDLGLQRCFFQEFQANPHQVLFSGPLRFQIYLPYFSLVKPLSQKKKDSPKKEFWEIKGKNLLIYLSQKRIQEITLFGPIAGKSDSKGFSGSQMIWNIPEKWIKLTSNEFAKYWEGEINIQDRVLEYDISKNKLSSYGGGPWKKEKRKDKE